MVNTERTERGLEARLTPGGPGRFIGAAFLLVWLTGWAVGECFALYMLFRGAASLITGQPIHSGQSVVPLAVAIGIGAFLLVWLSLWTLGGIAAIAQFLRMVWAHDLLIAGAENLIVEHHLGPFTFRRAIPRQDVRGLRVIPPRGVLIAETAKARIELSGLGGRPEREEIATLLERELGLDQRGSESRVELPDGWRDLITPEGTHVLAPDPAVQAKQARVAAVATLVSSSLAALLIRESLSRPLTWPITAIFGVFSLGLAWGTAWLLRGRMEWRIESGRIVLQRRYGASVTEIFRGTRLELTSSRDSDGDNWYDLEALASPGDAPAVVEDGPIARATGRGKNRRRIHRAMNDDATARRLGAWLSEHAGMPFEDHATANAVAVDLAQLRAQLEASGTLGKLAGRFLSSLEQRRPR